jgi:hypothetical protein
MLTQNQSQSIAIDKPADKVMRNPLIAMVTKPACTLLNRSLPQIGMHGKTISAKVDLEPQRAAQTEALILCRRISSNVHSLKAPLREHKAAP